MSYLYPRLRTQRSFHYHLRRPTLVRKYVHVHWLGLISIHIFICLYFYSGAFIESPFVSSGCLGSFFIESQFISCGWLGSFFLSFEFDYVELYYVVITHIWFNIYSKIYTKNERYRPGVSGACKRLNKPTSYVCLCANIFPIWLSVVLG